MKTFGFARICCAVPRVKAAAVHSNLKEIIALLHEAAEEKPDLLLLPELAISGYSCGDLFHHSPLPEKSKDALLLLKKESRVFDFPLIAGLPLALEGALYNCAAVLCKGRILGIVPKTYLPNSGEFYEQRWFSSGQTCSVREIMVEGESLPFGTDLIFRDEENPLMSFGVEICEDLWSPLPPSTELSLAGALIIANPSASNELIGKAAYRRRLVSQQSARCIGAYAYCSAGTGESTTDTLYGGHSLVCEYGRLLEESPRFSSRAHLTCCDVDLEFLEKQRMKSSTFSQTKEARQRPFRQISYRGGSPAPVNKIRRRINPHPFVPSAGEDRQSRCREILSIQSTALAARLKHIHCHTAVLGLSGGLDSTLALLVSMEAFGQLGLSLEGLKCYTMPGFGTSSRTKGNAEKLCEELGIPMETVDIREACTLQLKELDHSGAPSDTAYENVQARQRTAFLMNKANMLGGIVIGTGDLSELALGWCTYNGDHMSMYAVNTGVPKTLIRYLVEYAAEKQENKAAARILKDIVATPISPELLPPDKAGKISQKTEELVGPYELHDFFLYNFVRCGFGPRKIFYLAVRAFAGSYSSDSILLWLKTFIRRFFSQQFKRSCLPDGPKVGTIALSPRGDWRMPSDGSAEIWLAELENPDLQETSFLYEEGD